MYFLIKSGILLWVKIMGSIFFRVLLVLLWRKYKYCVVGTSWIMLFVGFAFIALQVIFVMAKEMPL